MGFKSEHWKAEKGKYSLTTLRKSWRGRLLLFFFQNRRMLRRQIFNGFNLQTWAEGQAWSEYRKSGMKCQKGKWKVVGYGNNQMCRNFQAPQGIGWIVAELLKYFLKLSWMSMYHPPRPPPLILEHISQNSIFKSRQLSHYGFMLARVIFFDYWYQWEASNRQKCSLPAWQISFFSHKGQPF